jgi:hypothetical protein
MSEQIPQWLSRSRAMRRKLSQSRLYLYKNHEIVAFMDRLIPENEEDDNVIYKFYRMEAKEHLYLNHEEVNKDILQPMSRMNDDFIASQLATLAHDHSDRARNWWSMYAGERDARLKG